MHKRCTTFLSHAGATFKIAEISVKWNRSDKAKLRLRAFSNSKERAIRGGWRGGGGEIGLFTRNAFTLEERNRAWTHWTQWSRKILLVSLIVRVLGVFYWRDVWTMHLSDESLLLVASSLIELGSFFRFSFFQDRKLNSRCHQRKFYSSI